MKNVIITGANGYIGHNLTNFLLQHGITVYATDLPCSTNHLPQHRNLNVILTQYDDFSSVINTINGAEIDVMYHLAWHGVGTDQKNNFKRQEPNIALVLRGVDLAAEVHCKKFICPGSISEYAYSTLPVDGNGTPSPGDMYAACKTAAHFISKLYAKQKSIGFIWLLIASIYGPGRNDNNIITYTIEKLLAGETPSYTKLEQMWDYLYIDDLMRALYLVGEKGIVGNTYAIGSGTAKPLKEYIEAIHTIIAANVSLDIGAIPYKTSNIDNSIADITLLHKHTGFSVQTPFEIGIKKTIKYYKTGNNYHDA